MSDLSINPSYRSKIHPKKFALYTSFASITMMFAAFTSAYIVKQAGGNWLEFAIPTQFYISTAAILISSVVLHLSLKGFKQGNQNRHKYGMIAGTILGIVFIAMQCSGWMTLVDNGIYLKGNASGSFFYLITLVHALHIIGGIAALFVALYHTFTLKFEATPQRILRYELTVHYWHFVDVLWIYLLMFLIFIK